MGKNHLNGKKFGKHTTIIDAAILLVKATEKRPEVTKISLGEIKKAHPAPQRIKFKEIFVANKVVGLELMVRGSVWVQKINIRTDDPELTQCELQKIWDKKKR